MASNVQVSVKDEASARKWLDMVQSINTDYQKAMALSQELDEKKRLLEAAMEQWEQESLLLMEMQE